MVTTPQSKYIPYLMNQLSTDDYYFLVDPFGRYKSISFSIENAPISGFKEVLKPVEESLLFLGHYRLSQGLRQLLK